MIDYKCEKCMWWDNKHVWVALPYTGFCRKHKPFSEKRGNRIWGGWPLTDKNDFCGEFRDGMPK